MYPTNCLKIRSSFPLENNFNVTSTLVIYNCFTLSKIMKHKTDTVLNTNSLIYMPTEKTILL